MGSLGQGSGFPSEPRLFRLGCQGGLKTDGHISKTPLAASESRLGGGVVQ